MNQSDVALLPLLSEMAESFGNSLSKGALVTYVKHLRGYSLEALETAIYSVIEHEEKFPSVAVLKKKYLNKQKNLRIDEEAKRQARYVKDYLKSGQEPPYHDPITYEVMSLHLPFSDWKSRTEEDINKYFTMMFVKSYKEIADDEQAFKDAQKKLKEADTGPKITEEDYTTQLMRDNRAFVKEMESATGEEYYRYHLHPWGIREGWYSYGKAIMMEDEDFKKQLLESEIFCRDYPRSVCYMKKIPKDKWPKLKKEVPAGVPASEESIKKMLSVIKGCDKKYKSNRYAEKFK